MKTRILLFAMFVMAAFNSNAQMFCNAAFSYTVSPSGVVTFYSSSTTINNTQSFTWSFGNGTSGYGTQTTCAYNAPGVYTVCLTVQDSSTSTLGGPCIDTSCNTVTIAGTTPCSASFTYAVNTSAANTFDFTSTSTGSNLSYLWYWNDGTPYGTTQNATHTFPTAGPYVVSLSVTSPNPNGCSDSTWQTVTGSSSNPCNASFFVYPDTASGAAPHTYIGINTSTGAGLSYTWIWGDGSANGSGAYPSHTYAAAGNYTICLVVMGNGCVDSFCVNATINKGTAMYTVNFQAPSGLNTVSKTQATLYPNPADDKLFIIGDSKTTYQVEIFNMNGAKLLSTTAKGNQAIDINTLPVNLYMVKISDAEGKSQFAKFMKQ